MLVRARDRVAPGRRIVGIAGEEVGDARMIEDVVGGETPDPRKSPDVDGKPGARGVPATCARVGAAPGQTDLNGTAPGDAYGHRLSQFERFDRASCQDVNAREFASRNVTIA